MNPLDEYHLDLRGYKIPFLENLSATNDQFGTIDLTDNEMVTMVLFKMWKTYPSAIDQIDGKMKKALCDKDHQVMAATLNYFADVVKKSPADYKDLMNSFVVILRQIVEHRLPEDKPDEMMKSSGYMKVSYIKKLAEEAGFILVKQSEINANPKDAKDYPKGVWTLPPNYAEGDTDKAKYAAIGESDRMTLLFYKGVKGGSTRKGGTVGGR